MGYRHRPVDPETIEYLKALYDGNIRFSSAHLKNLVESFQPRNGRPNLIIITADHGEEFKEHGVLEHSLYLHEELVRVPLLFIYDGVIPGGLQSEVPAQNADILPTVADLLGLDPPRGLQGRSLASVLLQASDRRVAQPYSPFRDVIFYQQNPANWGIAAKRKR